jgi:hypothetical protein
MEEEEGGEENAGGEKRRQMEGGGGGIKLAGLMKLTPTAIRMRGNGCQRGRLIDERRRRQVGWKMNGR